MRPPGGTVESTGVSVIVPHYGDAAPVRTLVSDLQVQKTDRPVQVIVVDDCSPVVLRDLPEDVTLIRRRTNGGFGMAVNTGVVVAEHDLLLVLNSDIRIEPDFLEQLAQAADELPACVIGPATFDHDGTFSLTARRFPSAWRQSLEWLVPLRRWHPSPWFLGLTGRDMRCSPGVRRRVDWVQGSALMLPTETFRSVDGFDPHFFMYSEEVDLQRRLRARGVMTIFVGDVSVVHEGGASTDPSRAIEWLVRSQFTYAAKWGFETRLRVMLLSVTIANLCWNSLRLAFGREASPIAALRREWHLATLRPWAADAQ